MRCANIGSKEIKRRILMGWVMLILGVLDAYLLIRRRFTPAAYLTLFVPFFFAGLGFFQAKSKVCVLYARQGVARFSDSFEKIQDPDVMASIKKSSAHIYLFSFCFAALSTGLAIMIRHFLG